MTTDGYPGLGEVFAPEVVHDMTDLGFGVFEGIETIRRAAMRLGDRNPIAHHVTNVVIVNEGPGKATVSSNSTPWPIDRGPYSMRSCPVGNTAARIG